MNESLIKLIGRFKALFRWGKLSRKADFKLGEEFQFPENITFCHKGKVHIFVRGLADGKLHMAKNRSCSDIRFYKKQNLRVFCATCRKRLV